MDRNSHRRAGVDALQPDILRKVFPVHRGMFALTALFFDKAGSGRSASSIAGQIGVTTNPQVSSAGQHAARVSVMNAASKR